MNDSPRQKLAELVRRYGREVAGDARRCEALLKDFCPQHKREVFVLVSAAKESVGVELLGSSDGIPKEAVLSRLTKRVHENLGLPENLARWAVESWALALGLASVADFRFPFRCPGCSVAGTMPTRLAGHKVTCPKCKVVLCISENGRQISVEGARGAPGRPTSGYFAETVSAQGSTSTVGWPVFAEEDDLLSEFPRVSAEEIFRQTLRRVLDDGIVTDEERAEVRKVQGDLGITPDVAAKILEEVKKELARMGPPISVRVGQRFGIESQARRMLGFDLCTGAVATVADGTPRIMQGPAHVNPSHTWPELAESRHMLTSRFPELSLNSQDLAVLGVPVGLGYVERCRLASVAVGRSHVRLLEAPILAALAHTFTDRSRRASSYLSLVARQLPDYNEAIVLRYAEGLYQVIAMSFQRREELSAQQEGFAGTMRAALSDAHLENVDFILIIQDSDRVPEQYVRGVLSDPNTPIQPVTAEHVAYGGAIYAKVLCGEQPDILILQTIPYSVSVETLGGASARLIDRNTTIPTERSQVFCSAHDGQSAITVPVYAGEGATAKDNTLLGAVRLAGLPPSPRAAIRIVVKVGCDANGVLEVSAKNLGTGSTNSLRLDASSVATSIPYVPHDERIDFLRENELEQDRMAAGHGTEDVACAQRAPRPSKGEQI